MLPLRENDVVSNILIGIFGASVLAGTLALSGAISGASLTVTGAVSAPQITASSTNVSGSSNDQLLNVSSTASLNGAVNAPNATTTLAGLSVTGTSMLTFLNVSGAFLVPNATTTLAGLNVTGTSIVAFENITGADTVGGLLTANGGVTNNGAGIVNGNFTVSSTLLFANSTSKQVAVGTSTALGADFTVHNNAGTASGTLMLGTSADGSKRGTLCFWNGSTFTNLWMGSNGVVTSTSATCP